MLSAEERALEREAKKGMNEEEAVFSVESALEQTYEWSDKYRPRKPRYGAGGVTLSDPDPAFYVDAVPDPETKSDSDPVQRGWNIKRQL